MDIKTIMRRAVYGFLILLVSSLCIQFLGAESAPEEPPCRPFEIGEPLGNYFIPGSLGAIPYLDSQGRSLLMDAFIQPGPGPHPGILVVHGGGGTVGSRITYVSQFLETLTQAGFNWFSIDYRLAPAADASGQAEDVLAAVRFVRCHARTLRTSPDRLGILGEESGAGLALSAALTPSADLQTAILIGGSYPEIVLDNAHLTPTLVIHGAGDREVPIERAREFCSSLTSRGEICELVEVRDATRRAENWTPSQWGYKARLVQWLSRQLGAPTPAASAADQFNGPFRRNVLFGTAARTDGTRVKLLLDAFIPPSSEPVPAVVLVHGGGWEAGDKTTYLTPILAPLARAGMAWFSINYRLTPEFTNADQLEDLRRAIRFVRHNAARFNIDPQRIAILGESAGGQMVLQVAALPCPGRDDDPDPVNRQPCQVQAVVSFYGVYDFTAMVKDTGPRSLLVRLFHYARLDETGQQFLRRFSPIYSIGENLAPLLMVNGTAEFLWQQAQDLRQVLIRKNLRHDLLKLEGAPHGMENWEGRPEWAHYKQAVVEWLRKEMPPRKP